MITAKIIKDSTCQNGKRLTTFELEYPRFIHAELMTHRALSKNSASSRALPVKFMISQVWNNMAMPVHWGKQQGGMQAKEELVGWALTFSKLLWVLSGKMMCILTWFLLKCKLHKQVANRILEPWSHIKIVLSATEFDNFFHLRKHLDAQPEIHELARQMYREYINSKPMNLELGEWHLPYVESDRGESNIRYFINLTQEESALRYPDKDGYFREYFTLEQAQILSSSLCAQVSYRKSDFSLVKAIKIYNRLVESKPVHASPFEHQGTPEGWPDARSGNFKGWKQYRELIPDNVCYKYEDGT